MASQLPATAHASLASVTELREHLAKAKQECDESFDGVEKLAERLETDRKTLRDAVNELHQTVEAAEKTLSDDLTQAESELGEITAASHEAGTQGRQALDAETAAQHAAAQQLDQVETQVVALGEMAATVSRSALERADAIEDALKKLVDETEQLLGVELVAWVAEVEKEIENTGIAMKSLLDDQVPNILDEKQKEWMSKMPVLRDTMEKAFYDLQHHTDEVISYSVEKLGVIMDAELDGVELPMQVLESEMESVARVAEHQQGQIEAAGKKLTTKADADETAAKEVDQEFHQVHGQWALFGFGI